MKLSTVLSDELKKRRIKNPRYSLRAFARDLGISSGRLSEILNDEYLPGRKILVRLGQALNISEEIILEFDHQIVNQKKSTAENKNVRILTEEELSLMSSIEHYAVFILISTFKANYTIACIAKKLGMSESKTRNSIAVLTKIGLIKSENGLYSRTHKRITTSQDIPSKILRESHKQILNHAIASLDATPPEFRDITSITVPVDVTTIPKVKKQIQIFRRRIAKMLDGKDKTEVYNLNIQLVPLTKVKS